MASRSAATGGARKKNGLRRSGKRSPRSEMQHSRLSTKRSALFAASTTSGATSGACGSSRRRCATPRPSIVSPASARRSVLIFAVRRRDATTGARRRTRGGDPSGSGTVTERACHPHSVKYSGGAVGVERDAASDRPPSPVRAHAARPRRFRSRVLWVARAVMNTRTLGSTGLQVSEIGYGAWGIGGTGWLGAQDDESLRALHRAVDLGITFIDTALGYGDGHSEELVGRVVRERPEEVVVSTKIPPVNGLWPM